MRPRPGPRLEPTRAARARFPVAHTDPPPRAHPAPWLTRPAMPCTLPPLPFALRPPFGVDSTYPSCLVGRGKSAVREAPPVLGAVCPDSHPEGRPVCGSGTGARRPGGWRPCCWSQGHPCSASKPWLRDPSGRTSAPCTPSSPAFSGRASRRRRASTRVARPRPSSRRSTSRSWSAPAFGDPGCPALPPLWPVSHAAALLALGRTPSGSAALAAGALSPYQIEYAQDARAYALFVAPATGQLLAWFRFASTHRSLWLALFAACGAASLYAHHLGAVTQAALGVIALATAIGDRLASTAPSSHRRLGRRELWSALLRSDRPRLLPQHPNPSLLRSELRAAGLLTPSPRFYTSSPRAGRSCRPVCLYDLCFGVACVGRARGRASLALLGDRLPIRVQPDHSQVLVWRALMTATGRPAVVATAP